MKYRVVVKDCLVKGNEPSIYHYEWTEEKGDCQYGQRCVIKQIMSERPSDTATSALEFEVTLGLFESTIRLTNDSDVYAKSYIEDEKLNIVTE